VVVTEYALTLFCNFKNVAFAVVALMVILFPPDFEK
jgi:hypothetical protein